MSVLCLCGFDCSDFMARHQISADARVNCPACDEALLPSMELAREAGMPNDVELTSVAAAATPVS
jgi:hypothetical protein